MLAETDLDTVVATIEAERPDVCVIDSVQTLHAADLTGAPGSVGQVREVADAHHGASPSATAPRVLLVGHVTKEGALAGPRVLEHLVDCVLQFEGERERTYRTLRALKNRFGSTNEVGVFEMRDGGLVEVARRRRPASSPRPRARPGSVVLVRDGGHAAAARRGPGAGRADRARAAAPGRQRHRPQPAGAGARGARPPRAASASGTADVFVNVVGGVRVDEPGADLAVALAVAVARTRRRRSAARTRACRSPASASSG